MLRLPIVSAMALAIGALSFAPPAAADVLLIQRVEATRDVSLPRRGTTMAQVEKQFGNPIQRHAPVGGGSAQRPPITRWDYPAFSVYFEHSHVVNSVLTRSNAQEIAPKPVG